MCVSCNYTTWPHASTLPIRATVRKRSIPPLRVSTKKQTRWRFALAFRYHGDKQGTSLFLAVVASGLPQACLESPKNHSLKLSVPNIRRFNLKNQQSNPSLTMSFFVDIVTEDSFYENLTLGIVKLLENTTCVKNVRVERRNGCDAAAITNWEQRHCCTLPDDIRNFYASVDGFLLQWNLEISGEEFSVGRMEVGSLSSLKRYVNLNKEKQPGISGSELSFALEAEPGPANVDTMEEAMFPAALSGNSRGCRLFEIGQCFPASGNGKIYMVYRYKSTEQESPSIWLHKEDKDRWYHLADGFTRYFRMMLVHLGLPLWQCCVVGLPLPTWVEQVYFLVGPHLLPSTIEPTETISSSLWNNGPTNVLDAAIFKGKENKQRNPRKK